MKILQLFKKETYPRRFHGECQRCQRIDYLPWATEHGERYCGHCFEKDALGYARLAGWTAPPASTATNEATVMTSIERAK